MITFRTPLIEIPADPSRIRQAAVANALWARDLRAADEETEPLLRALLGNPGRFQGHPVPWDLARRFRTWLDAQGKRKTEGVSTCGLVAAGLLLRLLDLPWDGCWYWEGPGAYRGRDIVVCLGLLGDATHSKRPATELARPGDIGCIGSGLSTHIYSATGWDGEYLLSVDGGQIDRIEDDPRGRSLQRTRQCRRLWSGMQRVWTLDLEILGARLSRRSWLVPQGWEQVQLVEAPAAAHVAYQLGTTRGVQGALLELGYDVGKVDGIQGPRTRAAVMAFQRTAGLEVDGVVGPLTRAALARAVG